MIEIGLSIEETIARELESDREGQRRLRANSACGSRVS